MLFNFGTSFIQAGSFDIESSISDVFLQTDEHEQERLCELFECSVEVLSKIHLVSRVEVMECFPFLFLAFCFLFFFNLLF